MHKLPFFNDSILKLEINKINIQLKRYNHDNTSILLSYIYFFLVCKRAITQYNIKLRVIIINFNIIISLAYTLYRIAFRKWISGKAYRWIVFDTN